jgi:hypothetical protein
VRYSLLLLGTLSCALAAPDAVLSPYSMDWKNNSRALVDASMLLDAPAGKTGFLSIFRGLPDDRRGFA